MSENQGFLAVGCGTKFVDELTCAFLKLGFFMSGFLKFGFVMSEFLKFGFLMSGECTHVLVCVFTKNHMILYNNCV